MGDGTDRLTVGDLLALVVSLAMDEGSALARSLNPDRAPMAHQLGVDQINATLLLNHTLRSIHTEKNKREKFTPLRTYSGSPWDPKSPAMFNPGESLGGYRRMSRDEARAWAASRGVAIP